MTCESMKVRNDRNSSVELLKICAIFFVVMSHTSSTLLLKNEVWIGSHGIVGTATTDVNAIILMLFYQLGPLGNNIFLTCSAYFLVGKENFSRQKGFFLLCTVWCISIGILLIYLVVGHYNLTLMDILKQLFPTTFNTNWYLTSYIILLFVYPYLNKMINSVNQVQLLKMVLFSSSLWVLADYIVTSSFFPSRVILWVTIYLLIAYLKIYCVKLMSNLKAGFVIFIVGLIGFIGQVVITNFVGLHINLFSNRVMRWNENCCPFYIMIAIGLLIIALKFQYKRRLINYISGLSLFVYLIHDNYLFAKYTRPTIWQWLYTTYGYDHVVLLDLCFAVLLFCVSIILSILYIETIQKLVKNISGKLYFVVSNAYGKIENFILEKLS